LVELLSPIVAAEENYANGEAKQRLYNAYLRRGDLRQAEEDKIGALRDYEAALALQVTDSSEAQTKQATLFAEIQQPATEEPSATDEPIVEATEAPAPTEEANPSGILIRFESPVIVGPQENSIFGGPFADVVLEWEALAPLADDEYYDVTVRHIFGEEYRYWGAATRETQLKLVPADIRVGEAGGDRFEWWVTARKADTAPPGQTLDLAISQQSEIRSFQWPP
ncbi:MAG: hypothetical protein AAF485_19395, partial [Chloroflexota bacterium]